jgi:hypothetical protein
MRHSAQVRVAVEEVALSAVQRGGGTHSVACPKLAKMGLLGRCWRVLPVLTPNIYIYIY